MHILPKTPPQSPTIIRSPPFFIPKEEITPPMNGSITPPEPNITRAKIYSDIKSVNTVIIRIAKINGGMIMKAARKKILSESTPISANFYAIVCVNNSTPSEEHHSGATRGLQRLGVPLGIAIQ